MSLFQAVIAKFRRPAQTAPEAFAAAEQFGGLVIDAKGPLNVEAGTIDAPSMPIADLERPESSVPTTIAAPDFPSPAIIPPYKADQKWSWGDIHVHAFMHTGAIVAGGYGGGQSVVIKGWGTPASGPCSNWGVTERTISGSWDVGRDRVHCTYPCTALTRFGYPRSLVRSLTPLIPVGTVSDDPALLIVPYGKYAGLMLGQLTADEKQDVLSIVRRWDARQAIKNASFWPESHARRPAMVGVPELPQGVQCSIHSVVEGGRGVWVVGIANMLPREKFQLVNDRARMLGGAYRSVQRGATITGFHFTDEQRARAFIGATRDMAVKSETDPDTHAIRP